MSVKNKVARTQLYCLMVWYIDWMYINKHFVERYKTKKNILAFFLLLVNSFIVWNISLQVPEISIKWDSTPISIENPVQAKFEPNQSIPEEKTIEEKIAETFPENPELMIAVFKAESGLNQYATHKNTNGTRDIGIAQINSVHGEDDLEMFDVDKNLKAARAIYDKQGIMAWYGFSNGGYKQYMK